MQLKYMGSKSWLAPHVDRLLGDVAVLHSPFSPLSLEGVSQMVYILPERLPALVRPAFDLVLKRCVQACGCKIETPRYACNLAPGCISSEPTFAGLRKNKKKKKTRGPKKRGPRKKGKRGFLWQRLTSLEMQPGAKLRRISRGLYFAATRLSFAGRGQTLDGRVLGASQVEYKPFGKLPLKRELQHKCQHKCHLAICVHIPAAPSRGTSPGSLPNAHNFNMSDYMSDEHVLGTPGAPPCRAKPPNLHSPPGPCYMCYMCYILHAKPPNLHSPPGPCYMCYMCYILHAKPPNLHSPPGPCYMCYMCYILHAKPPNLHSPAGPCYMCYMCYILHAKPLNIHSPPGPCYMCCMCYILHAKPLNIHSPPGPCYMYYMCYILCTREICTICAI